MRDKIIQVLWVDDDPLITDAYPREAEMLEGIEIVPFLCWEDAEEALEDDYNRWDTILLDAKCSFRRGDPDKAPRFLMNVFRRIESLAKAKIALSLGMSFLGKVKMIYMTLFLLKSNGTPIGQEFLTDVFTLKMERFKSEESKFKSVTHYIVA